MSSRGTVFILDDDELILSMLSKVLKKEGYDVHAEAKTEDVVNKIKSWSPDVVLLDIKLPERSGLEILQELKTNAITSQVIMLTADDTAETAVKAMKLGAIDYLTKPFNTEEVKIVINNALEKERLKDEVNYLRKVYVETVEKDIIGVSREIKELLGNIEKMAYAHAQSLLITGESGTGKELLARHFHHLVHNKTSSGYAPFIEVNCVALPETLLETELFGYEKGAFTDAKSDKKGLFEAAKGGSILLDEIGDMKPSLQGKLLRVLEERTIRHIGGIKELPIDVNVIATTNRNLPDLVKNNKFRNDLYYRLNTFFLHIAPLRERKEDIPLLARHFLSMFALRYNKKNPKDFSPEAEKLMISYQWPGNVRELKNVIEKIVVLESSEEILPEHLPREIISQSIPISNKGYILPETGISLEEVEKDLIRQALEKAKHNKTLAAKLLNISYDTLRYQIKKFGIK